MREHHEPHDAPAESACTDGRVADARSRTAVSPTRDPTARERIHCDPFTHRKHARSADQQPTNRSGHGRWRPTSDGRGRLTVADDPTEWGAADDPTGRDAADETGEVAS